MRMQETIGMVRIRTLVMSAAGLVAVLALTFAIGPHLNREDNGPANKTRMRLMSIATILETFKSKQGRFPTDSEGLSGAAKLAGLNSAAERSIVLDGWGALFKYRAGSPPVVYSIGANGQDDGGGADDVTLAAVVSK